MFSSFSHVSSSQKATEARSEERIAVLPEGYRPEREVRCMVPLLVNPDPNEPSSDYVAWRPHIALRNSPAAG